jgi:hypothetical protein
MRNIAYYYSEIRKGQVFQEVDFSARDWEFEFFKIDESLIHELSYPIYFP